MNLTVLPNRISCIWIVVSRLTNTTWVDDMGETRTNVTRYMGMTEEEAVRIAGAPNLQPLFYRVVVIEITKKRIAWRAVTGHASLTVQGEFET